jgi:hypothetical protein
MLFICVPSTNHHVVVLVSRIIICVVRPTNEAAGSFAFHGIVSCPVPQNTQSCSSISPPVLYTYNRGVKLQYLVACRIPAQLATRLARMSWSKIAPGGISDSCWRLDADRAVPQEPIKCQDGGVRDALSHFWHVARG